MCSARGQGCSVGQRHPIRRAASEPGNGEGFHSPISSGNAHVTIIGCLLKMERAARVELASSAWKAEAQPLYHTRLECCAPGSLSDTPSIGFADRLPVLHHASRRYRPSSWPSERGASEICVSSPQPPQHKQNVPAPLKTRSLLHRKHYHTSPLNWSTISNDARAIRATYLGESSYK